MFPLLLPFLPAVLVIGSVLASPIHPDPRGGVNSTLERSLSSVPAENVSISVRNLNSGPNCFPAIGFNTPSNAPSSLQGGGVKPKNTSASDGPPLHLSTLFVFLIRRGHLTPGWQFGFDSSDQWKSRRDSLFSALHSNPLGKFVTRVSNLAPSLCTTTSCHTTSLLSRCWRPSRVCRIWGFRSL
jgi:hypothetical protein